MRKLTILFLAALALETGCTKEPEVSTVKRIPAGQQYAGFLKDYANLKPSPLFEGNTLTYAKVDAQKNIHRYIAVIVDPVQVYLASDADGAKVSEKAREAAANYFRAVLVKDISSAFPVVTEPGPLVLRLRAAIIGVDVGGAVAAADKGQDTANAIENAMNIGKVGTEMELVDSESGEQIVAMVDHEPLGAGAEIGSVSFSKEEKWAMARGAFDQWARRVRDFLDGANELSAEEAKHADESYHPYGGEAYAKP